MEPGIIFRLSVDTFLYSRNVFKIRSLLAWFIKCWVFQVFLAKILWKIQKKSPFVERKDFLKARSDYLYLLFTFDFLTLNSFPPFCEVTSGEPVLVIAHLKPIVRSDLSSSLNLRAPGDNQ